MYKVIIADDEAIVREGIAGNMDFAALGFELAAMCENGKDAMEQIKRHGPEVVITDISMPFADGLAVAEFTMRNFPQTKTVLLTGYNEFEFAQKAVKLKVYDYVLKPLSARNLRELLMRIRQELDRENKELRSISELHRNLHCSQEIVREHYLNTLTLSRQQPEDVQAKFRELCIEMDFAGDFTALIVDIDNIADVKARVSMDYDLLNYAVCNICADLLPENAIAFRNKQAQTTILMNDAKNAGSLAAKIRQTVQESLGFAVSVYIGNAVEGIENIAAAYSSAAYAFEHKYLFSDSGVIYAEYINENKNVLRFYGKRYDQEITTAIKTGSEQGLQDCIGRMLEDIRAAYLSNEQTSFYIQNLIAAVLRALNELDTFDSGEFSAPAVPELNDSFTLNDLSEFLLRFSLGAIGYLGRLKGGYNKMQTQRAVSYIDTHFSNPDLSLSELCAYLSVSVSHFSNLFKNETGLTFIEYLTRLRMQKAQDFMQNTDLKNYEIAERVGILDPHYFSVIFKKFTSLSPKEYREANEKQKHHL